MRRRIKIRRRYTYFWSNSMKNQSYFRGSTIFVTLLFISLASVSANLAQTETVNRLLTDAREKGSVRIIVGVKLAESFSPEGDFTDDARKEQQRAEIRQTQDTLLGQIGKFAIADVKQFEFIPFFALEIDSAGLEFLIDSPIVLSITEDALADPTLAESTAIIGAPAAWSAGATGQNWAVAILDTGVFKTHQFLNGKVVSEACYSTNDAPNGRSSLCPNGVSATTAVNSGLPCDSTFTSCDHGTHVAGIAAGRNGSGGINGVGKDADIIAIQVFTRIENCNNGQACIRTFSSDYIRALERVYTLRNTFNIASVNMSFGGGSYATHCDADLAAVKAAIDNLRSEKIASVIASGNDDSTNAISGPACISTAISVGSTEDGNANQVDTVSGFSNSASILDLLAPGNLIRSSGVNGNASYVNKGGTSMAAPHVAGAWAVLRDRVPNASVSDVLNSLTQTGVPITDTRNGVNRVKPRIQIDQALYNLRCSNAAALSLPFEIPVNGSLGDLDCTQNNRRRDIYKFNGTAGQQIRVTMQSNAFDTRLYLYDSGGNLLVENDDFGTGTNSRILPSGYFALPATTTYYVAAAAKASFGAGQYQIILEEKTTNLPNNGEIAFHSDRDGNFEIYKMNADGSGETLLSNHPATDRYPIFSPDGRKIAFQSNRDGNNEIYIMNADGTEQTRLTFDTSVNEATDFSPDGSRILFQTNRDGDYEIYTMGLDGANQTRLTNNTVTDADAKFSLDGLQIVFRSSRDGNNEIYRMNANGSSQTRLTNDSASDSSPIFSPDGSRIAFHSHRNGNADIYLMFPDGTNLRRLTFDSADDVVPIWSPESGNIIFHSDRESAQNDIFAMSANGGTVTPLTSTSAFDGFASWQRTPTGIALPTISINDVSVAEPANGTATATFMVSVEGQITSPVSLLFATINDSATSPNDFQPRNPTAMTFINGETSKQIAITINADQAAETAETFFVKLTNITNAVASKSLGTGMIRSQYDFNGKIVFASRRSGNQEIFTMNADGSQILRLTNSTAVDSLPKFSPDGTKIVFDTQIGTGNRQLFTMNADGTNLIQLTNLTNTENYDASFSPDNSTVLFTRIASGNAGDVFTINADGTNLKRLTTNMQSDSEPRFSPDGTKIVFTRFVTVLNSEIYLMNADGSQQTRLTNQTAADVEPSFSATGGQIVFVTNRNGNFEIYTMRSNGSGVRRVTNNTGEDRLPTFSPDGDKILFQSERNGFVGESDIYAINPNGTGETQMTNHAAFDGQASWQPRVLAPTAASASISGRVTANGRGVGRATVQIVDPGTNEIKTAITNGFGYYRFDEIEAGGTYLVSVRHKTLQFAPRVVNVSDDVTELDFEPLE